eukprot:7326773-Prymnesium_polylepis.1
MQCQWDHVGARCGEGVSGFRLQCACTAWGPGRRSRRTGGLVRMVSFCCALAALGSPQTRFCSVCASVARARPKAKPGTIPHHKWGGRVIRWKYP